MKKKINYKLTLGLVIGIIISITSVYAATTYFGTASELVYDNADSKLSSSDVQGALDELYQYYQDPCPDEYTCYRENLLEPGDYVSYTPTKTSYSINLYANGTAGTSNGTSAQYIYPSRLKLWRVLSKNEDGTVDIISEYLSYSTVRIQGRKGYATLVSFLNELASQYEVEGITVGSRYPGYNGQTELITNNSIFNGAVLTSSTTNNNDEKIGGGDILYSDDYDLIYNVLGTRVAYPVNTPTTPQSYILASRNFIYTSSTNYQYCMRSINTSGNLTDSCLYKRADGVWSWTLRIRPIVTLKAGLKYSGEGTSESPWKIK